MPLLHNLFRPVQNKCDSEISDTHLPFGVQQKIRGLDVAVQNPAPMRIRQCLCRLKPQPRDSLRIMHAALVKSFALN